MLLNRTTNFISAQWKAWAAIICFLILVTLIQFNREISGSFEETFTVVENDAASSCLRRSSIFHGRKHRSEIPQKPYGASNHYCGLIFTDHGLFQLTPSDRDYWLNDNRTEVDQKLKVGCKVTAKIVGKGKPYREGQRQRFPVLLYISKIVEEHGCS